MSERKWLTDKRVADRYDVSRATVWNWRRDGILPPGRRFGPRAHRWSIEELDAHDEATKESCE